jgi:hypothetical protein
MGYHLVNRFPTVHAALLIFHGVRISRQTRFRKPLLYPTELRGHSQISMSCCSTGSRSWGQVFPVCSRCALQEVFLNVQRRLNQVTFPPCIMPLRSQRSRHALLPLRQHAFADVFEFWMVVDVGAQLRGDSLHRIRHVYQDFTHTGG